MKLHLVTPANPPSFWTYDEILPTLGRRCLFPNLSMPTVAGLTPRDVDITLCDENVGSIDFDVDANVVGITGYIVHRERILRLVDEFKRRGRFVVVGGPFASLCPEELRGRCDVLFVGEAEETWPQFLDDFGRGEWQAEYEAAERPMLDTAPMPRFDLMPVDLYHNMAVQFARGCPFTCEFCDIIVVYGRRPRVKPVEHVMDEIRECHRLGAAQVFIVDDNFIGNRDLAKGLLRELARWGRENDYPLTFNTEVSINVAQDDELLALLRDANFVTLFIGIETPRRDSLKETKKLQNLRVDPVEAVHKVESYGIQVQAGMIVGFDHDDLAIFDEHLHFIRDARIPVSMTGMLQALPRTPLRDRMEREGRLITESLGDHFVFSNIEPAKMSQLELFRGYRRLVRQLYDYREFGRRSREFLRHRGERVSSHPVRRREIRLFLRILLDTVVRGGPRRALFTLRLLGQTLIERPSVFADAVSLAIIHRGLAAYIAALEHHLDAVIETLEDGGRAPSDRWDTSLQQPVRLP